VKEDMSRFKQKMKIHAAAQPAQLEQQTRGQHNNKLWFDERKHRITASICGKVLQRPTRAVVREILYPKPMLYLPPPIAWGRRHEGTARALYEQKMTLELHRRVTAQDCGLFVHPVDGWLGAIPDATIHIDGSQEYAGILEIKCPYRWREDSVLNACKDPEF
jgi:ribosomal protein S27E